MYRAPIIAARVLPELNPGESVVLGPGLPVSIRNLLPESSGFRTTAEAAGSGSTFDLAIVQGLEVSANGDLAVSPETRLDGWDARRWIVLGLLGGDSGILISRACRYPVGKAGRADLIITDLGVIKVGKVGFELIELAPGFSSDDVRRRVRASLHVADGIGRVRVAG